MLEVGCVHLNAYGMPKQKAGIVVSTFEGTDVDWRTVTGAALREERKEAHAHHPTVPYSTIPSPHTACSRSTARTMPARGNRYLDLGGQHQQSPRGLTFQTTLPVPASGSFIRTHSSTDTHPKGRNRGITYRLVAET